MTTECQPVDAAMLILHPPFDPERGKSCAREETKCRDLDEDLRCCEPSRLTVADSFAPPRRRHDHGKHDGNCHHPCDHMEGFTIRSARLAHIGNEQRSKCAR